MQAQRFHSTVEITGSTHDWTDRGYMSDGTQRGSKRVWHRQFGTDDEARAELEQVREIKRAQLQTGSTRTKFDAPTMQRVQARRGQSFQACHDADEVCVHCGRDIHRGETVCYEYARDGGHRTLVHESCDAAHAYDEAAGHAIGTTDVYGGDE